MKSRVDNHLNIESLGSIPPSNLYFKKSETYIKVERIEKWILIYLSSWFTNCQNFTTFALFLSWMYKDSIYLSVYISFIYLSIIYYLSTNHLSSIYQSIIYHHLSSIYHLSIHPSLFIYMNKYSWIIFRLMDFSPVLPLFILPILPIVAKESWLLVLLIFPSTFDRHLYFLTHKDVPVSFSLPQPWK